MRRHKLRQGSTARTRQERIGQDDHTRNHKVKQIVCPSLPNELRFLEKVHYQPQAGPGEKFLPAMEACLGTCT